MREKASGSGRKKQLIIVSGLLLACFLAIHLCFNLTSLWGERVYNSTYRCMNAQPALQLLVSLCGLGVMVHILLAFFIAAKNHYSVPAKSKKKASGFLSMLTPGVIILGFGAIHMANFWQKTRLQQLLGRAVEESPYLLVSGLFRQPLYVAVYLIWIGALWYHISRGGWNIVATLAPPAEAAAGKYRLHQQISVCFATLIAIGFAIIPLWFAFGLDK